MAHVCEASVAFIELSHQALEWPPKAFETPTSIKARNNRAVMIPVL